MIADNSSKTSVRVVTTSREIAPCLGRPLSGPDYGELAIAKYGTYADRCSRCGASTAPVDAELPTHMRACVPCLLAALDKDVEVRRQYEEDTGHADDTGHEDDLADARREADDYAAQLVKLRDSFASQEDKLLDQAKLIESMRATIDELQAAVDSRADDDAAFHNKITLLEQDVMMWRSRATKTTAT